MPVSIQFADHGTGAILKLSEHYTGTELTDALSAFIEHHRPMLGNIRYWYCDHSAVTVPDVSRDEMLRLSALSLEESGINPQLVVAICAPQDISFGLGRMWESLVAQTDWQTRVFRDGDQAKAWLREIIGQDLTFC